MPTFSLPLAARSSVSRAHDILVIVEAERGIGNSRLLQDPVLDSKEARCFFMLLACKERAMYLSVS